MFFSSKFLIHDMNKEAHKISFLLFTQLYIIRVSLGKSAVTCVYAFLPKKPKKTQETYEELFMVFQDRSSELGSSDDSTTPRTFLSSYPVHLEKDAGFWIGTALL